MKLFTDTLLIEVDSQLHAIHSKTGNPLEHAAQAIKILIPAFEKLKTELLNHKGLNKSDEISFFKESKPQLAAKLIYYNEIYTIESSKPLLSIYHVKLIV